MLKSQTGVLVVHIFANAAEEKIDFLKTTGRDQREVLGEKIRREELEREFREKDSEKCPGTQVPVPECVMQKRFLAAGESYICNTLIARGLGGRENA